MGFASPVRTNFCWFKQVVEASEIVQEVAGTEH